MLTAIKKLNDAAYWPRHYVAAKALCGVPFGDGIHLHSIHRSREVHQSWASTLCSTLYAFLESLVLVLRVRPEVVICNGPGTCIPIQLAALLMRALCIHSSVQLVFLESFCRVNDLSMSGRIAYRFVDLFVVQWPGLTQKYPTSRYIGRIF